MILRLMEHVDRWKRSHGLTAIMMAAEFGHTGLVFDKKAIAMQLHKERKRQWEAAHPGEPMPHQPLSRPAHAKERFMPHRLEPASHPIVRKLFLLCNENRVSLREVEDRAGLGRGTIHNWRKHNPKLPDIEAAFNVFDMTLSPHSVKDLGGRPRTDRSAEGAPMR